jgi:hypothetical protein
MLNTREGEVMKLKKRLEFKPKKVKITRQSKAEAPPIPRGGRIGKRWEPY